MQANKKTREGADHPDRDAQFRHIDQSAAAAIAAGQPVISIDTKKRELVGDFKAVGREFQPKGQPVAVRGHDFKDKLLGHAIPYGIYDLLADEGWVSIGITKDTATFAVNAILSWWKHLGSSRYPNATTLTITADGGGSNSSRGRLWKLELQRLADLTGLQIQVCHFPPGTSKWNKIEHRMFSFISLNWRGKPLESLQIIMSYPGIDGDFPTRISVLPTGSRRAYVPRKAVPAGAEGSSGPDGPSVRPSDRAGRQGSGCRSGVAEELGQARSGGRRRP